MRDVQAHLLLGCCLVAAYAYADKPATVPVADHALLLLPRSAALDLQPAIEESSRLPDLGDSASSQLSAQEERRIADMAARSLRRSGDVLDDAEITDYLLQLGTRVAAASQDNGFSFRFLPIKDQQINAFAVPGGLIGVNLGLIVLSQHESELAGVLAHEIAHVTQHHYARLLESQKGSGLVSLAAIALAILAARNNSQIAEAAVSASQGAMAQRYLDFSRDFEREADRIGMSTLLRAGFDPRGIPQFFDRMQRHYRQSDAGAFAFLRTHPVTSERIADSLGRMDHLPYRQWSDSMDYLLVREKTRVLQLGQEAALAYYTASTRNRTYANAVAQYYGHAWALSQAGQWRAAWQSLQLARQKLNPTHPLLESLAAQIQIELGDWAAASTLYQEARQRFPMARGLIYGEIDLALRRNRLAEAQNLLDQALRERAGDAELLRRQADLHHRQGRDFESHQSMAAHYLALDEPTQAIEQLNIARQKGGDFYQLSALEAQLKVLQKRVEASEDKSR